MKGSDIQQIKFACKNGFTFQAGGNEVEIN